MSRGRPSARPSSRTSSLNSSRSGSSSFRCSVSGKPADVVVRLDRVRLLGLGAAPTRSRRDRSCPARATSRFGELRRLGLEHLDELAADDLALLLGIGDAGERAEEGRAGVDEIDLDAPRCRANISITCAASSRRSRPLSTKTQVSWSPMARWISAAATDESTPPERPRITSSPPTCARIFATASST